MEGGDGDAEVEEVGPDEAGHQHQVDRGGLEVEESGSVPESQDESAEKPLAQVGHLLHAEGVQGHVDEERRRHGGGADEGCGQGLGVRRRDDEDAFSRSTGENEGEEEREREDEGSLEGVRQLEETAPADVEKALS